VFIEYSGLFGYVAMSIGKQLTDILEGLVAFNFAVWSVHASWTAETPKMERQQALPKPSLRTGIVSVPLYRRCSL
jgi:hypothetical protein